VPCQERRAQDCHRGPRVEHRPLREVPQHHARDSRRDHGGVCREGEGARRRQGGVPRQERRAQDCHRRPRVQRRALREVPQHHARDSRRDHGGVCREGEGARRRQGGVPRQERRAQDCHRRPRVQRRALREVPQHHAHDSGQDDDRVRREGGGAHRRQGAVARAQRRSQDCHRRPRVQRRPLRGLAQRHARDSRRDHGGVCREGEGARCR